MRRSDAQLAEVPRGVDATALAKAAKLWQRAGPELSESVAAALVQAEEGEAAQTAGRLDGTPPPPSADSRYDYGGDTGADADGARIEAGIDFGLGSMPPLFPSEPLTEHDAAIEPELGGDWDAAAVEGGFRRTRGGEVPPLPLGAGPGEGGTSPPAHPGAGFASMSAVVGAVEKAATRSSDRAAARGGAAGAGRLQSSAARRHVAEGGDADEMGPEAKEEDGADGAGGPTAEQQAAARQLRRQLLELRRLRALESRWDARASVTRAKDNSKLPLR